MEFEVVAGPKLKSPCSYQGTLIDSIDASILSMVHSTSASLA